MLRESLIDPVTATGKIASLLPTRKRREWRPEKRAQLLRGRECTLLLSQVLLLILRKDIAQTLVIGVTIQFLAR